MDTTHDDGGRPRTTVRPARWARLAAYAVPVCLLPSALWRAHLVTWDGGWYPLLLSALQMGAGLLTLGLVQSWGEVFPRWIPGVGGRPVPYALAVVPATVGAIVVTLLSAYGVINGIFHFVTPEQAQALSPGSSDPSSRPDVAAPGRWVDALYAPLLLWGPLLAAVVLNYHRRRTNVPNPASSLNRPGPGGESALE